MAGNRCRSYPTTSSRTPTLTRAPYSVGMESKKSSVRTGGNFFAVPRAMRSVERGCASAAGRRRELSRAHLRHNSETRIIMCQSRITANLHAWRREMSVEKILAGKGREVVTVQPHRTLGEVAKILTEKGIGAVVVTDSS